MSIFGGLFGGSSSTTELPEYQQRANEYTLNRGIDMSQVGYQPYAGPQVAAFDQAQIASMQNTNQAANAFGMNSAMPNIMPATDYGNGVWGYSSMPLYQQQQDWMAQNRPGQKEYYDGFFINPLTGDSGSRMADTTERGILSQFLPDFGGAGDHGYGGAPTGGGGIGGYSGFADMFDGGGAGQSGSTYGGALGGVSNAAGASPNEGLGGFFGGLF